MVSPINLDNLHSMTDGNAEFEREIFRLFLVSSREAMASLRLSCDQNNNEMWGKEAHALKGISLNLGADALGALCKHAQESAAAPQADKEIMLAALEHELTRVHEALQPFM